ncbi:VWA domain-containing protein [Pseudomonadota bacterium]
MNKQIASINKSVISVVASLAIIGGIAQADLLSNQSPTSNGQQPVISMAEVNQPKIQIAILLDTSGSMDGLIDQARNQLWQTVNEFSKSSRNGVKPVLEVALYEYGNDNINANQGHTRQVLPLTRNLDQVSEALFSLTTNGGNEYCGYAIKASVSELRWSDSDNDIKAIFIAGNEPFSQGPVSFSGAIAMANTAGVTVNTIHAGGYDTGISEGWQKGALLAGGNYMNIDHNQQVAHVVAPQDKRIAELNQKLNETYIPYGNDGSEGKGRQQEQDSNTQGISIGLLAKRVKAKVSSLYENSNWDLVDAISADRVQMESLDEEALPEEMKEMKIDARADYIAAKAQHRNEIKQELGDLIADRDSYVEQERENSATAAAPTIVDSLTSAVRQQGEKKSFVFE